MSDTDSVTISLLPVSLSLVHLPRSRLEHFTSHVLRQILQPNPTFLNVTCNEIEVSLFAEHDALQDFHTAARKDARTIRRRERDVLADSLQSSRRSRRVKEDWEPIEVTSERWKVLQIDSHSDRLDTSGARVHELSAPIAAAGISIFYQSSYMCDFIFVKESRLTEVMSLLGSAGFDLYLSDPTNLTAQVSAFTSPLLSPEVGDEEESTNPFDLHSTVNPCRKGFDTDAGVIFTRSRSNTNGTSSSSGSRSRVPSQRMSSVNDLLDLERATEADLSASPVGTEGRPPPVRSVSHSPSMCDVRVLSPDITCVGLSDDSAETWGLKIVKLVAFPELIVGPSGQPAHARRGRRACEASPVLSALPEEHIHVISLSEGEAGSGSDTTTRVSPDSPKKDPLDRSDSQSPEFDLEQETVIDDADDADESSDDDDDSERDVRPRLAHLQTASTVKIGNPRVRSRSSSQSTSSSMSSSYSPLVPFFSFTRTPEGSSLAAPVSLLATLFPASERHMVMCSQELDVLDSRNASPERWAEEDEGAAEDEDADSALPEPEGMLKCLQIDLRKFGLEKHGLVNRFSRTLEENGINHMYSSTYKTANLLVDKAHANRAQALLRSS
ncbi:hypothetical protein BD309DRAFT_1022439 [Dichomitus squalens]|uniref:CASTOR ACT domain-containing protein n=1 Tax=Dichomitus squalens TaxID=114155 RepID=A0A4Q9NHL8_9APHY|nr:hypothetical protein BD311DRAFT_478156 [Dichomitus squalens]TBU39021.1 hypothetical protein BD309DRAFT_1022439 [Dichomitus squalens]TBU58440.1 hypothetical protein BD310DRAFT_485654 [Dichomitus squalens]